MQMTPTQRQWFYWFLQGLFSLVLAFSLNQSDFLKLEYVEFFSYDTRVRFRPTQPTSNKVRLVAIDKHTIQKLGRTPSVSDHTQFLETLLKHKPKAVIYALNPQNLAGTYKQFMEFARVAQRFEHFYISVNDVAPLEEQSKLRLKPPLDKLQALSGPKTFDRKIFAKDDVTRRMITSFQGIATLHVEVAKLFNPEWSTDAELSGSFDFLDSRQVFIDFHPDGTYPQISFADAMSSEKIPTSWHQQAVFIGQTTGETSEDYIRSPFSRSVLAMPMLEVHANMLDTVLLNSAPTRAPQWLNLFITALVAFFTVRVSLVLRPLRGIFLLFSSVILFSLIAYALFAFGNVWIAMAEPLVAFFVSYYFFIPYRLIMENRRSWEYYEQNRLLTQVEELKNNFISMMSHDLKTPLARIQGMTELISADNNPLSHQQANALNTIRNSADELLNFISSILDVGRIESTEVQLNISSKDVNVLLTEVISSMAYLGQAKKIEITTEFETLFSIPMDVDLMRQVFMNLLENSIKYSPEGTRVLVSTEEANGRIVIQFADQGRGIPPEELPHIFLKFYRSKNAKSSKVKGTGLGLYLAKYFVELHRGTILVDSDVNHGTTFTVELPVG